MKVLITTDTYSNAINGVVTSITTLVNELERRGHEVKILALSEHSHSYNNGNVYCVRSMPVGVYPKARMTFAYHHRFVEELIKWKPDIIHSQCELFSMPYANRISKLTGAPIVHTYHTIYEEYVKYVGFDAKNGKRMVAYLSRERLKHVSAIIAPTKKTEIVLKGYRIKKDIAVVPTGIPLERYQARISKEERSEMRNNLGIFDDNFLLVYLGRVGTEKKIDEVLKTFAKARQINKKLMFMIVGDGPSKGDFESLAESLGVSDAVVFTGMVDHADVHKYYQLGDVFVSGSTSETQGLTYIEAAANGLPLLCRKDPCLEKVIFQGENGYQYETEEEFFEYLSLMLDDEWRENASKKSEKVAETFGTDIFGDEIEKVYAAVLENK